MTATAELWSLTEAVCAGLATPGQGERLNALLADDEEALLFYVTYRRMHGVLLWHCRDALVGERGAPRRPSPMPPSFFPSTVGVLGNAWQSTLGCFPESWSVAYLIATVITGLGILGLWLMPVSHSEQVATHSVPPAAQRQLAPEPLPASVGRITGMVDCKWAEEVAGGGWRVAGNVSQKSLVSLGDKFLLSSGLMEITYNTGAKVILQGPVTYQVEANGGYLAVGKLTGKLEKSGEWRVESGEAVTNHKSEIINHKSSLSTIHYPLFTITTPTATVTDLGTEFGVEVNRDGITDMHVFTGSVRMAMAGNLGGDAKEQIVYAGNSVRADSGVHHIAAIKPSEQRFVRNLAPYTAAGRADAYAALVLSMQPFAYYRMECPKDKKDALVVFDSAPGGHHGMIHSANSADWDPWRSGCFGDAIGLRGPDFGDYVDVPDFPTSPSNQLSVSAWVYCLRRGDWSKIANEGDWRHGTNPVPAQFELSVWWEGELTAGVVQRNGTAAGAREAPSKPFPLGQWQHVALAADGAVLRLYRNGVEVAAVPCDGVYRGPPVKHLTIGCHNGAEPSDPLDLVRPVGCWTGRIDELAIFHHVLSAQQVQRLFDGRHTQSNEAAAE